MTIPAPKLYQFRYAMFPEKARWALDYCGVAYQSRAILPGPHVPIMAAVAQQKTTPALKTASGWLKSSSEIVYWAAQQNPQAGLMGQNDEDAKAIIDLVNEFDLIGPHARRAYFSAFLQDTHYAADLFSSGCSAATQALYRAAFPGIKGIMKIDMNIWPKQVENSIAIAGKALDKVAKLTAATDYLVGDQFTAADLTAATILSVCVLPDEYPIEVPQPRPAALQNWLAQWKNHPAATWVKTIYNQHRGTPLAIGGL